MSQQTLEKASIIQTRQEALNNEITQKLSLEFDKKMEDQFNRFQQAMAAMARPAPPDLSQPSPKCGAVERNQDDFTTIITQALIHNQPEQEVDLSKKTNRNTSEIKETSRSGRTVEETSGNVQTPEVMPSQLPQDVNNAATNGWLLEQTRNQYSSKLFQVLPTSIHDFTPDTDIDNQVQQIIATASHQLSQGVGKQGFFPHKYISRGPEWRRATLNSLSTQEHATGIFLMIDDARVPKKIKPHLLNHVQEVLDDACHYDWPNAVRRWSEEVFSAIAENRLKEGWEAHNTIQMMRMSPSRAYSARLGFTKEPSPAT